MIKLRLSIWLCLLVGLVAIASAGRAQEVNHALTVEQCRADQKLWFSKLEDPNDGTKHVTWAELRGWVYEMLDCFHVDPPLQWQYANTMGETNAEMTNRLQIFVLRHNLWNQFLAEDAQDKR